VKVDFKQVSNIHHYPGTVTLEEPRQGGRGEEASSTPSGVFQITLRTPRSPVMPPGWGERGVLLIQSRYWETFPSPGT
jgi:hypothetical protein